MNKIREKVQRAPRSQSAIEPRHQEEEKKILKSNALIDGVLISGRWPRFQAGFGGKCRPFEVLYTQILQTVREIFKFDARLAN